MNPRQLVTARQAAIVLNVPVGTVRSWHERGLLVSDRKGPGRGRPNLYHLGDVLAAERLARQSDPTRRRTTALVRRAAREAE